MCCHASLTIPCNSATGGGTDALQTALVASWKKEEKFPLFSQRESSAWDTVIWSRFTSNQLFFCMKATLIAGCECRLGAGTHETLNRWKMWHLLAQMKDRWRERRLQINPLYFFFLLTLPDKRQQPRPEGVSNNLQALDTRSHRGKQAQSGFFVNA